jgi:hypothetical protein
MIGRVSETQSTEDAPLAVATLEMTPAGSPCGTLIVADGRRTPFSGWAEFASVIEDWRATSAKSTASRDGARMGRP